MEIFGTNLGESLIGTALDDTIWGFEGNDFLNGVEGADRMIGGLGDDTYRVENEGDRVIEEEGEGQDRVQASISYRLTANVEELDLLGSADLNGFGNDLNNSILGNNGSNILYGYGGDDRIYGYDGDDVLNGGTGRDFLIGGNGNDTYIIDDTLDRIRQENATSGDNDVVRTTANFNLPDHVEVLTMLGNADLIGRGGNTDNSINGNGGNNRIEGRGGDDILRGNGGDDSIFGGDGEDQLIGGAGADVLSGGDDGDRYTITDSLDTVIESASGTGLDVMRSSVDITIADNVERLVLIGTASDATGNGDNNIIWGNGFANNIAGLEGDDELDGRGGDDTFIFAEADFGNDTLVTFDGAGVVGGDLLDVSAYGFIDIADMLANGVVFAANTIDFTGFGGADGTLTFSDVADTTTLIDSDFIFV